MAYSDIPPKGHSSLSSPFSCSWFHQWLFHTHQSDPLVVGGALQDNLVIAPSSKNFCRYRWLCYINPNFYGFSASAVLLLSNFESDCEINGGSKLECYTSSGHYVLDSFGFNDTNPYQNIVVSVYSTCTIHCCVECDPVYEK